MTVTVDDLREELAAEFFRSCRELAEARLRRQEKDTPDNRSVVEDRRAQIDRVLDMYIDMVRGARG